MDLRLLIAKRYFFAKKKHNVINIISAISATGIAIGSAALIIIMSIFNGFNGLIEQMHSGYEPDLLIERTDGKYFNTSDSLFGFLSSYGSSAQPTIEKEAFLTYGERASAAVIKGVDTSYASVCGMDKFIREGRFSLCDDGIDEAVAGLSLAYELGARTRFVTPIQLYFPGKRGGFSILNPESSMNRETVFLSGIFSIEYNLDRQYLFVSQQTARRLLSLEKGMCNAIEIYLSSATDSEIDKEAAKIRDILGNGYTVKDRYMQNEAIYKVAKSEKAAIYMILFFIILIISCNIFSSLSMLIIDKKEDIATLKSLGAEDRLIRNIFITEGWMVSMSGIIAGTLLGCIISLLQQHFGLVKMPGNFITDAYPVVLKVTDILITVAGCSLISAAISILPARIFHSVKA